jgi:phosphoglycolate phosphatase-like HAD superfamily hydrolase
MTAPDPSLPAPAALLLDVDGTLLDTVYLHVLAWWEAFEEQGHEVSCVDIHRAIGMGSSELVPALIGAPDEAVVEGHSRGWAPLRERCRPFHQVPELIREVAARGVRVVYATSGSEDDTEAFRDKLGCDDVVHAVVSSGDVEQAKPAPDIVLAALDAAGVAPERAVMVGDTVYDVRAAAAAGVPCIGVLAGGIGEKELRDAGAVAVYGNIAELLEGLDDSPVGALLEGRAAAPAGPLTG